jgi:lon-related putative ATP-dependent protease
MNIPKHKEVPLKKLRWQCDPKSFSFKTTEELKSCEDIIGQERALRAIKLGLEVKSPGYNIYVAGLTGTGKTTTIKHILEQIDTEGPIPDDICYVYNFSQPDMPIVLRLSAGKGGAFAIDMDDLVNNLTKDLPKIFESEEYKKRGKEVLTNIEGRAPDLFKDLEEKITKEGFSVVQVQMGPFSVRKILPVVKGKAVSLDQLQASIKKGEMDENEVEKLKKKHEELLEEMEEAVRESRKTEKDVQKALSDLEQQFCSPVVKNLINELKEKYPTEAVSKYLDDVDNYIMQNLEVFKGGEEKEHQFILPGMPMPHTNQFLEFKVNVVVDNSKLGRVPVITETAPNYKNLFGTIERVIDQTGIWRTDFTKIKAGSLLKANGGYLVLNLIDTLIEPGVWVALKRTLKNRKLDIQTYDPYHLYTTSALKPEPVDVDVKVVIVGDAHLYQLLYLYDEDFKKIFKVKADFDTIMSKDDVAINNYTSFVKKICDDEGLMPFTNSGVAEIIEYGVRLAGRQNKISTRFSDIADLLREAQYWAKEDDSKVIDGKHVNKAIDEKIYRSRMIEDKIQEMIEEGILMIDIEGKKLGQVNGLSIYNLGDYVFGRPSKITAEVSMGRAGIINIEREADLSGKTHNKGVLIIGGYFRGKYAHDKPLSMSASLAFEQNYSGVDGDSASSTEIYAILSELSGLPLRQDIAVTGSVNQKGEIQPIGGVNQKIEGFFEVCKAKGLTGKQGVIIPYQNVGDLMLKPEVVKAVKAGKFHVYPVKTIDEGIEILTGINAGRKRKDGKYLKETVNYLIDLRLRELATGMKEFYAGEEKKETL